MCLPRYIRVLFVVISVVSISTGVLGQKANSGFSDPLQRVVISVLKDQVLEEANRAMREAPVTITAVPAVASAGNRHDFYSEADYFWPNPKSADSPYVSKDGLTNPGNFVAHRKAMIRFSRIIGSLASAYKIAGDEKYVKQAVVHLNAWFIDTATGMNPNMLYAQAVKGKYTGRSYGIIDAIHLIEVAQGVIVMQNSPNLNAKTSYSVKKWFADYTYWLNNSKPGIQEKMNRNNHSTSWAMQVASFAKLCNDTILLDSLRFRYKTVLLPNQMAVDGSFPYEIARTKPYGYSIFNLDAMVMLCQILSTPDDDLWRFSTPDGKSVKKGISYLYPFVIDKTKWPFKQDVLYWNNWPVAQPFLVFGALAYSDEAWLATWKKLDHNPVTEEVVRNLPVRNPIIWL